VKYNWNCCRSNVKWSFQRHSWNSAGGTGRLN